jgi:hypothetical protein
MYVNDHPTSQQFKQNFSEALGCEMTPPERRWFQSIRAIVNGRK